VTGAGQSLRGPLTRVWTETASTEQTTYSVAGLLAADKYMVFLEGKLLSTSQYTIIDDSIEITDVNYPGFAIGGKIQIVKVK